MKNSRLDVADGEPTNKTLRWNVIGLALALSIAIGLVFLLDTGEFVDWIAHHRGSKLDETIVVAVVFLAGLCTYFVRRWLGAFPQLALARPIHDHSNRLIQAHIAHRIGNLDALALEGIP